MFTKIRVVGSALTRILAGSFLVAFCFSIVMTASQGKEREIPPATNLAAHTSTVTDQNVIPPGTILPVRLRSTISSDKSAPGQLIVGRIAQDVPLPNGSKIRAGSKIEGHVVEVIPAGSPSGPMLSIRFDKVYSQGKTIPVTTNLRAIAGFMEIMEAAVPEDGAAEGTPSNWWTTTQVGGDSVYGVGGPVMSAEHTSEVVGKSVGDGVLSRVSAKEGTKCRGSIAGNTAPQALWVFSSDACGTYGIEHVKITHAGRTDPVGTISLASDSPKLKIRSATGMLLRVDGPSRN